jgi:hypothetical protein
VRELLGESYSVQGSRGYLVVHSLLLLAVPLVAERSESPLRKQTAAVLARQANPSVRAFEPGVLFELSLHPPPAVASVTP